MIPRARPGHAPPQRAGVLIGVMISALVMSSCGSTAQVGDRDPLASGMVVQDESDPSPGTPRTTSPPSAPGQLTDEAQAADADGTAPGSSTPGDAGGEPSAAPTTGATHPSPTEPAGSSRGVASGTNGIDDDRIVIGLEYAEETAARSSLGSNQLSTGDMRQQWEAVLRYHNDRGGVVGRQLEAVYHVYDGSGSQPMESQQQAACANFTEDHEVYAVMGNRPTDTYLSCLDEAGVTMIAGGGRADDSTFARYERFLSPSDVSLSELGRFYPRTMTEADFFEPESLTGDVKVGLVTYDAPLFRRVVEDHLDPAMEAEGQAFEGVQYVSELQTLQDAGSVSAEVSSAVLRFKSRGIDHVMIVDYNGAIALFFMQAAESQDYRPQYGLNSGVGGQLLVGLVPAAQLRGSVFAGWSDIVDIGFGPARENQFDARATCEKIFADAGIQFSDGNAYAVALGQCGSLDLFVRSLEASTGSISPASVVQGAAALESTWQSPSTKVTRFTSERRYGAAHYRVGAFIEECECFRYISESRRM